MPLPDFHPRGAPDDDADPAERQAWRIGDARQAEWAMRKLAAHTERLAEAERQHAEWQAQIDDWFRDATAGDRREAEWATGALRAWATDVRADDPTSKTMHLPSGRVSTRWVPPHPEVRNAGEVAEALARAQVPTYDEIVHAEVRIDARKLAAATQLADGWWGTLTCGCTVVVWTGTGAEHPSGGSWPWHPDEHRCGATEAPPALAVARWERGKGNVVVAVNGDVVVPLPGVAVVPGRLAVSVNPRPAL
jgi:hypothetical protein